jgi:hypothetical protein
MNKNRRRQNRRMKMTDMEDKREQEGTERIRKDREQRRHGTR